MVYEGFSGSWPRWWRWPWSVARCSDAWAGLPTASSAMLGLAIAVGVAVLLGARGEDVGPYAPLLAIAAFMFCLMIGGAAALVTRRVKARHLTH